MRSLLPLKVSDLMSAARLSVMTARLYSSLFLQEDSLPYIKEYELYKVYKVRFDFNGRRHQTRELNNQTTLPHSFN